MRIPTPTIRRRSRDAAREILGEEYSKSLLRRCAILLDSFRKFSLIFDEVQTGIGDLNRVDNKDQPKDQRPKAKAHVCLYL